MKNSLLFLMVFFTMTFGLVKNSNAQCGITFTENVVQPTCFGASDGAITLMGLTGTNPPFSFMWPMGDTTQNVVNYASGSYQVYITDALSCQQMFNIDIPYTPGLVVTETVTNESGPMMYNGSINVTVSGGMPPYTFNWNNAMQSPTITGLMTGTYVVTVTDMNGCSVIGEYFVDQLPGECMNVTTYGYDASLAMCNGSADANVSGGVAPYSYLWSSGDTLSHADSLCSGSVWVTVTDANSCQVIKNLWINQSNMGVCGYTMYPTLYKAEYGMCNGSIQTYISGGMPPFSYQWSDLSNSTALNNICAGSYSLTVTDMNSCVETFTYSIEQECFATVLSATPTTMGYCDGTASVTVSNGTPPFTYYWDNGDTLFTAHNLCYGTHWVTITSLDSCQVTKQIFVNEQAAPECMTVTLNVINATTSMCNGSIEATIAGGTAPYTFNWNYGQTTGMISGLCYGEYWVTVTGADSCSVIKSVWVIEEACMTVSTTSTPTLGYNCNGTITATITNGVAPFSYIWNYGAATSENTIGGLCEGYHYVTVTDSLGCTNYGSSYVANVCNMYSNANVTPASLASNCDGGIQVQITGGTPPFTYSWNNYETTPNISNLCVGSYMVTVIDSLGCATNSYYTVGTKCDAIMTYPNSTNVSAPGNCDGTASIYVYGGTAPYSYLWSNTLTSDSIQNLCEGSYDVIVTDSVGCVKNVGVYIGNNCNLYAYPMTTNVSAPGNCDGSASLSVSNGTAPYSFVWSNAQTTDSVFGLCEGYHNFTVTDAIGCTVASNIYIGNNCNVYAYPSITPVSAPGNCDGKISLSVTSGIAPYTYSWDNAMFGDTITGLCEGNYAYTVTDNIGCVSSSYVTVGNNCSMYSSVNVTNESAPNKKDGLVEILVFSGVAPYTFTWNDGATSQINDSLTSGYYYYTVTDSIGCQTSSYAYVTNSCTLYAYAQSENVSVPNICDGKAFIFASNGVAPYSYIWTNSSVNDTLVNLCEGYYGYTVTDSIGCLYIGNVNIYNNCTLYAYFMPTDASAPGMCDGQIMTTVQGGTAPFSFNWNNLSTVQNLTNLCKGYYDVTITDAIGCKYMSGNYVGDGCGYLNVYGYTNPVSKVDTCDGSIFMNVYGDNPPFTYNWSNTSTNDSLLGLCQGEYFVTVTDNKGCSANSSFWIDLPYTGCSFSVMPQIYETSVDSCTGSIFLSVYGGPAKGASSFFFNWSTGDTLNYISNLCVGNYSVTVSDSFGCSQSFNYYVSKLSGNNCLSVYPSFTNTTLGMCDGSINLSVSGGTPPYTYVWQNGAIMDTTTTGYYGNLCVGEYWVTIYDADSCWESGNAFINENNSGTSCLNVMPTFTDASAGMCDGSILLSVSGGTPPYYYIWNNGVSTDTTMIGDKTGLCTGTYSVTIFDSDTCMFTASHFVDEIGSGVCGYYVVPTIFEANNAMCDGQISLSVTGGMSPYNYTWNNGKTTPAITGLCVGEYWVTIKDMNNCAEIHSYFVPVQTGGTCGIVANSTITNATNAMCNGKIDLSVANAALPISFVWSNGSLVQSPAGLCAGTYSVTISDAMACSLVKVYTVGLVPDSCNISTSAIVYEASSAVICDGQIDLSVIGGMPPYTYTWSNGKATPMISALCAGTYSVTVKDINNCVSLATHSVNVNASICNMNLTSTVLDQSYATCDGSINLIVNNFTPPLTFIWNNGSTVQSPSGLCQGVYSVFVTDAKGCSAVDSMIVGKQPLLCTLTANINNFSNITCFGGKDGFATVIPTGGKIPYTYEWNNGTTTPYSTGLSAGEYVVVVTDSKGCQVVKSIILTEAPEIQVVGVVTDVTVIGAHDGTIDLTVNGGNSPYTYNWTNGANTEDLTGLYMGAYLVQVKDSKGCFAIDTFKVKSPSCNMSAFISSKMNVSCYGGNDGSANVLALDGDGNYTYSWTNGATSAMALNLNAGVYVVSITDGTGCVAVSSAYITQPTAMNIVAYVADATIFGGSNGKIQASVIGGTSPYIYSWSNSVTSSVNDNLIAGTYDLTVTDANFCSVNKTFAVNQPINNGCDIVAGFTYSVNNLDVAFTNVSVGTFDKLYWEFGDWTTPNITQNPTYTYAEAGYKNVNLTVLNSVTGCKANYNQIIYVEDINVVSCAAEFEAMVDNTTQTVSLIDLSQGNIGNWSWNFGNGTSSDEQSPIVTYTNAGLKTISLSISDITGTCSNKIEKVIFVGTKPCMNVANFASVSNGMAASFMNYSTGAAVNYTWDFGDGYITSDENPTHTYNVSKAYNVKLKVSNADGTCLSQKEKQIVVGTNVPPMIEIVNNTPNVSAGSYVNLYADVLNYTTENEVNLNYYWILGDGSYYTTQTVTDHLFPKGGTYFVKLIVIDPIAKLVSMASSEILVVGGDDISNVGFVYTQTANGLVLEALDAISGENHYPFTYSWNFGDGSSIVDGNTATHIMSDGIYNVCITAKNALGIYKTSCGEVVVHTDTTTTPCLAVITYSVVPWENKATFWSTESVGNPADYTYAWDFGDSTYSNEANPEHIYTTPGYYLATLTVISKTKASCSHTAYEFINVGAGNNGFQGVFNLFGEPSTNKAAGYSVDFVGAAFGEPSMIEWDFGDGSERDSTTMRPSHTYYAVGDYEICLTLSDPYTGATDVYCDTLKVKDTDLYSPIIKEETASLNSYPNPFTTNTVVKYVLPYNTDVEIEMYDVLGKETILMESTNKTKGTYQFNLNRNDLKPGVYHIKLSTEKETITKRIVVIE